MLEEKQQAQNEQMFTKEAILKSEKYKKHKDLLNALLKEQSYTLKQIDRLLNAYLKKGVK